MRLIKCDKCGVQINCNPIMNAILPKYEITYMVDLGSPKAKIDLCNVCMDAFDKWLHELSKEDKDDD